MNCFSFFCFVFKSKADRFKISNRKMCNFCKSIEQTSEYTIITTRVKLPYKFSAFVWVHRFRWGVQLVRHSVQTRARNIEIIMKMNKMVLFRLIMLLLAGGRFRWNFLDVQCTLYAQLLSHIGFRAPIYLLECIDDIDRHAIFIEFLYSMQTFEHSRKRSKRKMKLQFPIVVRSNEMKMVRRFRSMLSRWQRYSGQRYKLIELCTHPDVLAIDE